MMRCFVLAVMVGCSKPVAPEVAEAAPSATAIVVVDAGASIDVAVDAVDAAVVLDAEIVHCGGTDCREGDVCNEIGPGGAIHETQFLCRPRSFVPTGAIHCRPVDGRGHRACMNLAP